MKRKSPAANKTKPVKKAQQFPRGWDDKRVRKVIAHYEGQTEDEELAEYEAARTIDGQTVMLVPTELVAEIRKLIARRRGA